MKALSKALYARTLSAATLFVAGEEMVEALREEFKGCTLEEVRELTLAPFAEACGITLQVSKSGTNAGKLGWPSRDVPGVEAASRRHKRFTARIMGETKPRQEPGIEVPAHIAKLAAALAKACAEYENARKLASTAVAEAFAA